jgi:serine/threonine-protein kinase
MFIQSPDDLIEELTEHPLLEPSQFAELTSTLRSSFSNHDDLARELMRRGWLTSFQVELLLLRQGADLVLGSYVLFDLIGEGHMGKVYKARQMPIGRVVAVKVIRPKHLDNPDAVRRFEREIRATAKLSHPNVITALDAGRSGDSSFLVMDYCEGTDLHRLVRKQGPLAVLQAVDYTRQAALGLQHAHDRGLVHRDVKPSNLLVTKPIAPVGPGPSITDSSYRSPHGVVKVLDLGLARLVAGDGSPADGSPEQVTTSGWIIGTPDYVAPEQTINAHAADIRSDLYSLGCTLYFMLTGQPPFPDASGAEKFHMHRNVEPTPVEEIRGDVPPRVGQIIRKLMAKQPRDRYQVPSELSTELAGLLVPKALGGLSEIHANPPLPAVSVPPAPMPAVGGDDGAPALAGWPLLFVIGCIVGGVLLVIVACLTMLRG